MIASACAAFSGGRTYWIETFETSRSKPRSWYCESIDLRAIARMGNWYCTEPRYGVTSYGTAVITGAVMATPFCASTPAVAQSATKRAPSAMARTLV